MACACYAAFVSAPCAALTALWAAPLAIQLGVGVLVLLLPWFAVSWAYQVIRKPAELFFPVRGMLAKAPAETWRQYRVFLQLAKAG